MKQLLQINRTGELLISDIPLPLPEDHQLLVRTAASLVSVGTERHMLEFAQKSLLGKALERPDLVRQVFAKARAEGIAEAWRQTLARLDVPAPVGYSSAGVVVGVGKAVKDFRLGDRVACSGAGFASHSEAFRVPANLCAKIPDGVDFESAAFAALGGIALQAVRMSRVSLGSHVAVIGLGLLGQLAVQLLRAAGCHVVGIDPDGSKVEMALRNGAEAATSNYRELRLLAPSAHGHAGFDSVIIFAATSSNQPLDEAAEICRERGRVVAAGLVGLEVPRKPFYDKELDFVVSRGWGPGLYDASYTSAGLDYPLPYARWTAQRNLAEFLFQLAKGSLHLQHLISHRFEFCKSIEAYELILSGSESHLGVLLTYQQENATLCERTSVLLKQPKSPRVVHASGEIGIGLVGAGLFARGTLLPILKRVPGLRFRGIASTSGLTARHVADKFGFEFCASEYQAVLEDPGTHLIMIATRHGSHASIAGDALCRGKHVFVEKPLATNREQLRGILAIFAADGFTTSSSNPLIMVGFNRRFSPTARWIKSKFADIREPLAIHCTVNTGSVPQDSWVYDPADGAGRIIGEVCHFVDLIQYLTSAQPQRVFAESMAPRHSHQTDNLALTLRMDDGSVGSIQYVSCGDKTYPRERLTIFGGGAVGLIDNFRSAHFVRQGKTARFRHWLAADKGHRAELEAFVDAIRIGSTPPIPLDDYARTTLATFALEDSLNTLAPVEVEPVALFSHSILAKSVAGS